MNLIDVIEISEQTHKISFKFGISISWYENRVLYHNLKNKINFNTLNEDEIKQVWIPKLIYDNTDDTEADTKPNASPHNN